MRARSWHRVIEWSLVTTMAVILVYQLALPPIVGLADSGDFRRIMPWAGLRHMSEDYEVKYFRYVNRYFSVSTEPNIRYRAFKSSEALFIVLATLLDEAIWPDGVFDLVVLGMLHSAALLCAVWLLIRGARPFGLLVQGCVAGMLLLVFTDVGYVAYFNSLYSEPAALVFLLMFVALDVLSASSDRIARICFVIQAFCALGLVLAKPQFSVLAVPIVALWLWRWRKQPRHGFAWGVIAASFLLCLTAGLAAWKGPELYRGLNLYNTVFYDILVHSPTPEADLTELGLPPQWASYAGTNGTEPTVPIRHPQFLAFVEKRGFPAILRFYVRHPTRAHDLLVDAARMGFGLRPKDRGRYYLGNFESTSGFPPLAQSQTFAAWGNLRERLIPKYIGFLIVYCLGNVAIGGWLSLGADDHRVRSIGELCTTLVLMTGAMFAAGVVGEGRVDLEKHLFLFNVLFDLLLICDVAYIVGWAGRRWGRRR